MSYISGLKFQALPTLPASVKVKQIDYDLAIDYPIFNGSGTLIASFPQPFHLISTSNHLPTARRLK